MPKWLNRGALAACMALLAACERAPVAPPQLAEGPARRIVALAPHLTELTYTAGAGDRLVGVVAYSDFPPQALQLPIIGDAFRVDLERLAELEPDLVLAWRSGNPEELVAQLRRQGYRVAEMTTAELTDIAHHLRQIGRLAGTAATADAAAARFERSLRQVLREYADAKPVSVFYQISARPLYTVGARHPIDEMIRSCGGRNVFGDLDEVAPVVSVEDVLLRAPQVIVAGPPPDLTGVMDHWQRWSSLPAVRDGHLYTVDASLVTRSSTRIVDGLRQLCLRLDRARDADYESASGDRG